MSSILDTITNELGGGAMAALGKAVGADANQTKSVVGVAIPAIMAGLAKNAAKPEGAASLHNALEKNHTPNLMDQLGPMAGALLGGGGGQSSGGLGGLASLAGGLLGGGGSSSSSSSAGGLAALLPAAVAMMQGGGGDAPKALNGGGILGHIFGGKQDDVANEVAAKSGVDGGIVKKLLPIIAPIVMSALGTMMKEKNLDAGGVQNLVQGEAAAMGAAPKADDDGFGFDDILKSGAGSLLGKLF